VEGEARLAGPQEPPTTSVRGVRTPPEANAIHVVISGPITRAAIAGLCERVGVALEGSGADLVVCDVGALVDPDAAMVDALARLQLTARRLGCQVRLRDACGELRELLTLVGLGEVVPTLGAVAARAGGAGRRPGKGARCRGRS